MFRPYPVKTFHKGQSYNGTWFLDGPELKLSSAYGSDAEPAAEDPDERKEQAERMFAALLNRR